MNTANRITIVRILMIPVFCAAAFCNKPYRWGRMGEVSASKISGTAAPTCYGRINLDPRVRVCEWWQVA